MIFHSIIPMEIVFGNKLESQEMNLLEMEYLGEKVQVSPLTNNQLVITRLISTSPKAYLNPDLQPGSVINRLNSR